MDFPAHVFWTWAVFKIAKEKTGKQINLKASIFWGVFPDLFAFAVPIMLLIIQLASGKISSSDLPGADKIEPPSENFNSIMGLVSILYPISHSFVVFFIIFAIASIFIYTKRQPRSLKFKDIIPWSFTGWVLHILIDIPTHSSAFYSTPFLWPISDIKFSGISWGTPWFMALNYFTMIIVYLLFLRKKK